MEGDSIQVEEAREEGLTEALALLRAFIASLGDPPLDGPAEARLREALSEGRYRLLLARAGGTPAGVASLSFAFSSYRAAPVAVFEDFFVLESFRRRGVGSRLAAFALDLARREGAGSLVAGAADPRLPLWPRLGFRSIGTMMAIDL